MGFDIADLISIQVEGKIVYINTAGAQMLGAVTSTQLIGKPILDFVHPDYREIAAERVRQMTTDGIVVCPSEERWLRSMDGDVEVAAMPFSMKANCGTANGSGG
jgi:PAS domain S-box-containing protein